MEEGAANGEDTKPDEAAAKKPLLDFKFPSTSAPLSFGTPNAAPAFSGFGPKPAAPSFAGFNSFSSLAKEDEGKSADEAEEQQEEENQDPIARQVSLIGIKKALLYMSSQAKHSLLASQFSSCERRLNVAVDSSHESSLFRRVDSQI